MGSITLWQGEQLGFLRCSSKRWRRETSVPIFDSLSEGTLAGGGGGGVPSRFSSTHFPRTGGEVRVGYDDTVRIAPCVRTPPRCSPSRVTLWNSSPSTPAIP